MLSFFIVLLHTPDNLYTHVQPLHSVNSVRVYLMASRFLAVQRDRGLAIKALPMRPNR